MNCYIGTEISSKTNNNHHDNSIPVCFPFCSRNAQYYGSWKYSSGDNFIWMDEVHCGYNNYFSDCSYSGFGRNRCSSYDSVGVFCGRLGLGKLQGKNINFFKARGRKTSRLEARGFGYENFKARGMKTSRLEVSRLQEQMVTVDTETTTIAYNAYNVTTQIRLVNSYSNSYNGFGRVEVYHNGTWGTVCDDSFDHIDAVVICGMLGYTDTSIVRYYSSGYFGQGSGQIWLDDLNCYGYEKDISQCGSGGWGNHNCGHGEDVGVSCTVRLRDGSNRWNGRVEVLHNGQWGTVCDDSFDVNDARVICTMLGNVRYYSSAYFGQGRGQIWLDDLNCNGYENDISQCGSGGWGNHNCGHGEDVVSFAKEDGISVYCSTNSWNIQVYLPTLYQRYPGLITSDIYLGQDSCTGYANAGELLYKNELVYAVHDPNYHFITRGYKFRIQISCHMSAIETVTDNIKQAHGHAESHIHNENVTGHYTVNMAFYDDSNFRYQKYGYPLTANIGDNVYVKVFTDIRDYNIKMRLNDCFTRPTPSAPDNLRFFLIRNGCPMDPNTHIISQSTHETRFKFQDFEYSTDHDNLYIYYSAPLTTTLHHTVPQKPVRECPGTMLCMMTCKGKYTLGATGNDGCKSCTCPSQHHVSSSHVATVHTAQHVQHQSKCTGTKLCMMTCHGRHILGPKGSDGCNTCTCLPKATPAPTPAPTKSCMATVLCMLSCKTGYSMGKTGSDGCQSCTCIAPPTQPPTTPAPKPLTCRKTIDCMINCKTGYELKGTGIDGCPLCSCRQLVEIIQKPVACKTALSCPKSCTLGYKCGTDGCPTCECLVAVQTDSMHCMTTCPMGYQLGGEDTNGCPTCTCLGSTGEIMTGLPHQNKCHTCETHTAVAVKTCDALAKCMLTCENGYIEGEIRLVNGYSNSYKKFGRVEVYHNGVWGTVCDDSFNHTDAVVICGMLGLSDITIQHILDQEEVKYGLMTWIWMGERYQSVYHILKNKSFKKNGDNATSVCQNAKCFKYPCRMFKTLLKIKYTSLQIYVYFVNFISVFLKSVQSNCGCI
ncbi:LOW QUALITY PROTEIN: hypothetical protein KUTeg_010738 [Tegillarca granosa]|uniref:Deleted in malignant brain tumors 1 protein n=1 Tax=Tegillarca granosa TaxID=220873 RepID=A0ABQ9F6Z9_TEGGR|nr:LOW QUALITY PROTEIN: hypothetical protein KUTeg_010738 [Tegillarca granosa]